MHVVVVAALSIGLAVAISGALAMGVPATAAARPAAATPAASDSGSAVAVPAATGLPSGFSTKTILSGRPDRGGGPTQFAFAPDGRIFVARKTGIVNVWTKNGAGTYVQHIWADIRTEVNSYQSRGLIGMTLDPQYSSNHRVCTCSSPRSSIPATPTRPEPAGGEVITLASQAGNLDAADSSSRITLMTGFPSIATLHSVALRFAGRHALRRARRR